MKCSFCGRMLKNPQSRELGYGPVCYRKVFGSRSKLGTKKRKEPPAAESADCYDIPGQISIEDYLLESGHF